MFNKASRRDLLWQIFYTVGTYIISCQHIVKHSDTDNIISQGLKESVLESCEIKVDG